MEPITAAIRELRTKHFEESQEAFAHRLGFSHRALASYESGDRRPTTPALIELMKAADSKGVEELGTVFQRAIESELGHKIMRFTPSKIVELVPGEEEEVVHAVLAIMRLKGKMYAELRPKLKQLCEPVMAANRAKDYRASLLGGLMTTVNDGLAAGLTAEQIIKQVPNADHELVKHFIETAQKLAELSKGGH